MDKAELLREFVFNAVPKGESLLRDPSGGQVRVQVRLLGFDGPPEFEELGAGDSADAAPTAAMTRELEELFDAVPAAALTSRDGTATTGDLRRSIAKVRESGVEGKGWVVAVENGGRREI